MKNMFKALNNEKGVSTLLIVMAVGALLASFILSLQMYVAARARIVARIRLAYKYTFVMEDAAKMVLNGRLEYISAVAAGGTCGAGKSTQDITNGKIVTVCLPS